VGDDERLHESTLTNSSSDDVTSASRDVTSSSVTSSDWMRLCFVRRFWNQTFTYEHQLVTGIIIIIIIIITIMIINRKRTRNLSYCL